MSLAKTVALLIACNAISITAQVFLKLGVGRTGEALKSARTVWKAALEPLIWIGAGCYGFGTLIWIKILSTTDLSFAYPFAAIGYAGGVLISQWMLKEKVPPLRWAGLALIALGVAFVASSG